MTSERLVPVAGELGVKIVADMVPIINALNTFLAENEGVVTGTTIGIGLGVSLSLLIKAIDSRLSKYETETDKTKQILEIVWLPTILRAMGGLIGASMDGTN